MNTAFLNCNIWSVNNLIRCSIDTCDFFLVSEVYYYNSLHSGIVDFNVDCIQIPEFEIQNIDLINQIHFNIINRHSIPILCRVDNCWKIDLIFYENYKLQPTNI